MASFHRLHSVVNMGMKSNVLSLTQENVVEVRSVVRVFYHSQRWGVENI